MASNQPAPTQSAFSNVVIGSTSPSGASGTKAMTADSIMSHASKAISGGPYLYWQAARPDRPLQLTNAVSHVNKSYSELPQGNHFVYWPDYRVAGQVSVIYNLFTQAGVNNVTVGQLNRDTGGQLGMRSQQVALSPQVIQENSIDPLLPRDRAYVEQLKEQSKQATSARGNLTFADWVLLGEVLTARRKEAKGGKSGAKTTATGLPGGSRAPEAKRNELVQTFTEMMNSVLSGIEPPKILNVSNFDQSKFTKAVKADSPKPSSRRATPQTPIRPVINVNGQPVQVPIMASANGAQNFMNFVNTVVASSQYSQYVPAILQAFNSIARPRLTPEVGQVGGTTLGSPTRGLQQGLGTYGLGVASAPVNLTGAIGQGQLSPASPRGGVTPGSPILGGVSPPPVQMPALTGGLGGFGGLGLPTLSQGQGQGQTLSGLPTLGQGQLGGVTGFSFPPQRT